MAEGVNKKKAARKTSKASKKGRPKGSKNVKVVCEAAATHCPRCGSCERSAYMGSPRVCRGFWQWNGKTYDTVIKRRTKCLRCHQVRIDQIYQKEN